MTFKMQGDSSLGGSRPCVGSSGGPTPRSRVCGFCLLNTQQPPGVWCGVPEFQLALSWIPDTPSAGEHNARGVELTSAGSTTTIKLSSVEFKLLALIDPLSFLRLAIMRPPRSKPEVYFSADEVKQGLHKLNKLLSDDRWFYKYQYYVDEKYFGSPGPFTGQISSFRLSGEDGCTFSIDSGIGYCKLCRIRIDPISGRGTSDGEIDVRTQSIIESLDRGIIRIERKPVAKQLRQKIVDLLDWANAHKDTVQLRQIKQ